MLLYVPVVFFTAKGIPGEVDERLDTKDGITSASSRALSKGEGGLEVIASSGWVNCDHHSLNPTSPTL